MYYANQELNKSVVTQSLSKYLRKPPRILRQALYDSRAYIFQPFDSYYLMQFKFLFFNQE